MNHLSDTPALGLWIKQTREAQGLTQAELAGIAGVGRRFLIELERGKETARVGTVLRIVSVLGGRLLVADAGEVAG